MSAVQQLCKFKYFAALLTLLWLGGVVVFFARSPMAKEEGSFGTEQDGEGSVALLSGKVNTIQARLKDLRDERDRVMALLKDCSKNGDKELSSSIGDSFGEQKAVGAVKSETDVSFPTASFEAARRNVEEQMTELRWFVEGELKALKGEIDSAIKKGSHESSMTALQHSVDDLMKLSGDRFRVLQRHMKQLKEEEDQNGWRENEALALSSLVQRRLDFLQNPPDCKKAKKFVCTLSKACGYGCQLHHLVYCLIMAYASQRTLVLRSQGWRYSKSGWEGIFLPLSRTCTETTTQTLAHWRGFAASEHDMEVLLPIIDAMKPRVPHLPLAIPTDISGSLMKFHGDPAAWWIGQMVFFLTRYQPDTQEFILEEQKKIGFNSDSPIVGVHIRRTDKVGSEAAFHSVDEYMHFVDEWFRAYDVERLPLGPVRRRVYVASDDPEVFSVLKKSYQEYEVLGNPDISKTAALNTRYSHNALMGLLFDIHNLARTDYLVCTFSSQVCRVAYEVMQALHVDASNRFKSLDDIYYYGGQNGHSRRAVLAHDKETQGKTPGGVGASKNAEIDFLPGDSIGFSGNHWNGYSMGTNARTGQKGLFPTYKTEDVIQIVDFPTYPDVPWEDPLKKRQ